MAAKNKTKTVIINESVTEKKAKGRPRKQVIQEAKLEDKTLEPVKEDSFKIRNLLYKTTDNRLEKTDYDLTRAVYFGQPYKDLNFQLAAAFGKPIVNSTTSFVIGNAPKVQFLAPMGLREQLEGDEIDPALEPLKESYEYADTKFNDWLSENLWVLYEAVRNALRDADCYVLAETEDSVRTLDPKDVRAIMDAYGALIGYRVRQEVTAENLETKKVETIVYQYDYYKQSPFKEVRIFDTNNPDGLLVYSEGMFASQLEDVEGERDLPIIQWSNEKESGKVYGNAEYRNVLYPMIKYGEVLEKAIINNRTASTPMPYVKGVADVGKFLKDNGTPVTLSNGQQGYQLNLDGRKVIIGAGPDFAIEVNEIPDTTGGAQTLLEILFYLICQGSETPEFLMGASVNASHASVDTQLPIIVRKAFRKQLEFRKALFDTIKAIAETMKVDPKFPVDYELKVNWGNIVDDDGKLSTEILQDLKEKGLVSDDTYAKVQYAKLGDAVGDYKAELEKAEKEQEELAANNDIFSKNINDALNKDENTDDNQDNQDDKAQ